MPAAAVLLAATAVGAPGNEVTIANEVRIQALSPTLLRIEPKGPRGFENGTTMMVVQRGFPGIPLRTLNQSAAEAWLATDSYLVHVTLPHPTPAPPPPVIPPPVTPSPAAPMCAARANTDVNDHRDCHRITSGPSELSKLTQQQCCDNCTEIEDCGAWVYQPTEQTCWLLQVGIGNKSHTDRVAGGNIIPDPNPPPSPLPPVTGMSASVMAHDGTVLWTVSELTQTESLLRWPGPLKAKAYAISDYPRFFAPEWGPTPIPAGETVDPALVATNGYDFRNNAAGDTYVFLLGSDLGGWHSARHEFNLLTGATPLLPDWAYGTWFSWNTDYSEAKAKSDIERWESDNLPIDVWALDMSWRDNSRMADHYYDRPNTKLFANYTEWFAYLHAKKLKTYFNDHPFPVDNQTSPTEVAFRWAGLSRWMEKGLDYWWFDPHWAHSIPPPNVPPAGSQGYNPPGYTPGVAPAWPNTTWCKSQGGAWDGMSNHEWGSHVYFASVARFDKEHPGRTVDARPVALTADSNKNTGQPWHRRYPVWWTGDGVQLRGSVTSMVDAGVHGMKPFVHSDCGGRGENASTHGVGGDLMRWAAHCAFGTILRFHSGSGPHDHRPWSYDNATEDAVRQYLDMRYRLMPSLVAGGKVAAESAYPIVARLDMTWPELAGADDNTQYLWLNDTLVAPILDSTTNVTTRGVLVPPGEWQDAWSGAVVTGPQHLNVSQPYHRIPMWHRRGGAVVATARPGLRAEGQDWGELVVEAFPDLSRLSVLSRRVPAQHRPARGASGAGAGEARLTTDPSARTVRFDVRDDTPRAWLLRLHLRPGQRARAEGAEVEHVVRRAGVAHAPFGGAGMPPAPSAGPIAELRVGAAAGARSVVLVVDVGVASE